MSTYLVHRCGGDQDIYASNIIEAAFAGGIFCYCISPGKSQNLSHVLGQGLSMVLCIFVWFFIMRNSLRRFEIFVGFCCEFRYSVRYDDFWCFAKFEYHFGVSILREQLNENPQFKRDLSLK